MTARDRLSAQVEWYYLSPGDERAGRTTARYFLERPRGRLAVQMIEFERIAMPLIVTWFQQAGRPAHRPPGVVLH